MYRGIQGGLSVLPDTQRPMISDGGLAANAPLNATGIDPRNPTANELSAFSNFGGTTDVKEQAKYLAKKGLIGANQLLTDHPDLSSRSGIINAQSDWKPAAISLMLSRAKKLGLRTPTEIANNREALLGALPERIKQAVNHPTFSQIHPNWWQVFDSVLKDQYDKEGSSATK